jgi:hypothetical protein
MRHTEPGPLPRTHGGVQICLSCWSSGYITLVFIYSHVFILLYSNKSRENRHPCHADHEGMVMACGHPLA